MAHYPKHVGVTVHGLGKVIVLVLGFGLVAPASGCAPQRVSVGIVGWEVEGGTSGRTWRGSDLKLDAAPPLAWSKEIPASYNLATVADETRLYTNVAMDMDIPGNVDDEAHRSATGLTAYNLADGQIVWHHPWRDIGFLALSGTRLLTVEPESVAAYDARTGHELWHRPAPWPTKGDRAEFPDTVVADESRLYMLSGAAHIWALDIADGKTAWSRHPANYLDRRSNEPFKMALANGILVLSMRMTEVVALSAPTGLTLWRARQGIVYPRVSAGLALVGHEWLQSVHGKANYVFFDALQASGLEVPVTHWSKELESMFNGTNQGAPENLATDGVRIYVRRQITGELCCFDLRNGNVLWKNRLGETGWYPEGHEPSPPVIAGDTALAISNRVGLMAVSCADGVERWRVPGVGGNLLVSGHYIIIRAPSKVWVFGPAPAMP